MKLVEDYGAVEPILPQTAALDTRVAPIVTTKAAYASPVRTRGAAMIPLFAWLTSTSALASPWVRPQGSFYAKIAAGQFVGERRHATSASLYGELGLPARLGLTVTVPWARSVAADSRFSYINRDLGDLEIALSRALIQRGFALSASAGVRAPLYPDRGADRQAAWGSLAEAFPAPGDGTVDLDGRLELGHGLAWGTWGGWAEASAGYRHRLGAPVDSLTGGLRAGLVPRAQDHELGWIGVELAGVAPLVADPNTRSWLRAGAYASARLTPLLRVELGGGVTPIAHVASPGWDLSLGLSVQR